MNDETIYKNNPLHGLSLKNMLIEIVDYYGFDILYAYLSINCFDKNPDIASSVKFLKKTDWAREKVESFYLYQYKNLPRCSNEQFELPPRDRIVPEDQAPGEPAVLTMEEAQQLQEKRARKAAERSGSGSRSGAYGERSSPYKSGGRKNGGQSRGRDSNSNKNNSDSPEKTSSGGPVDPWANARLKNTD